MTSLAHEISELLRIERQTYENSREPTRSELVLLHERRRDLYFRVARECRAEGDVAGVSEATRAAGHAVTMTHRIAEIGVCAACGGFESVTWEGMADDQDSWHCTSCDRRWRTSSGGEPTEV